MITTLLRLLNCPNGQRINMMNAIVEHGKSQDNERFTSATIAITQTFDGAPDPLIIKNILDVEAIALGDRSIDRTVRTAAGIACHKCLGPVTDRTTGETFCGKYVPDETTQRNALFEQS